MTDLDIASLEETKIAPVFEAWQDLPEETRAHIDREFQDVHLMADELSLRTLLDEAHYHNEPLEEELASLEGFYAQAMWVLLERRSYFDVAVQFKTADELPPRYWEQRNNFPDFPPRDDHDSCDHLSGVLQAYFRAEGRGSTCVVEPYRRDDLYYFFAYLEDHAQTLMEFQNASLTKRVVRPAFDVVFVFNPKKGTLSTFYEGPRRARRGLQEIFARCLLGINLPDQPKDERIYNLDQLKNRGFDFVIDPRMGVQGLGLVQIKSSLPGSRKPRWTVEVDPSRDPEAICDELERLFSTGPGQGDRFPLALATVQRVVIRAYFPPSRGHRRPTRTFYISLPNGCNLDHEGRDATLREILVASGIELQASGPNSEAA